MPTYLVTGASRGIGYEFVRQLSEDAASTIIGMVRDKDATEKRFAEEVGRSNIHIVKGDLQDHNSLKNACREVASITGGSLDYLIANASFFPPNTGFATVADLMETPDQYLSDLEETFQVNVVGNIQLFNTFLPLILKGETKKVITLGSLNGDTDLTAKYNLATMVPYSISKAALNMAVAKYSAEYREKGVLFMSIAPGSTATFEPMTEKQQARLMEDTKRFMAHAPHFAGLASPAESVALVRKVMEKCSIENGDGGTYVSQFGNKQWQ